LWLYVVNFGISHILAIFKFQKLGLLNNSNKKIGLEFIWKEVVNIWVVHLFV
jgi:hypothetical protein